MEDILSKDLEGISRRISHNKDSTDKTATVITGRMVSETAMANTEQLDDLLMVRVILNIFQQLMLEIKVMAQVFMEALTA